MKAKPEERLWEQVRSLDPLPERYRGRFTHVQAAIGLAGLNRLPEFIDRTRWHAGMLNAVLGGVPGTETIVKRCIRRGVDVAPMHVDVCTQMGLFGWKGASAPGAEKAATAVPVPVYESLSDQEVERVGQVVRTPVERLGQLRNR